MAARWYVPRVGLRVLLRFREMACMRHESVVTREPLSRGTTILKDAASCRPCSPRKPTKPTKKTHTTATTHVPILLVEASSSMGYHTTHGPRPLSGLYRTSVNLEAIEFYLVCFNKPNRIIFMTIYY